MAALQNGHLAAQRLHHRQLVRHDDDGDADFFVDVAQRLQQRARGFAVQRRGRLIAQQHLGARRQPPRNGHALLLPARELRRVAARFFGQAHQRQALVDAGVDLGARMVAVDLQREGHVVEHRGVLQQIELLKNHADVLARLAQVAPRQARQLAPGHPHLARIGALEQVDQAQQGGFARTALANQAEHLALGDVERQRMHGIEHRALGQNKGFAHALEANHGRLGAALWNRRGHSKRIKSLGTCRWALPIKRRRF